MPKISRFKLNDVPEMPCRYCTHWYEATKSGFQDEEENAEVEKKTRRKKEGTGKCHTANKEVTRIDPQCADFVMHRDFWCDRDYRFYDVVVCIARQKRQYDGCLKCRQGSLIWQYVQATQFNEKEAV